MKKIFTVIFTLSTLIFLGACSKENQVDQETLSQAKNLMQYAGEQNKDYLEAHDYDTSSDEYTNHSAVYQFENEEGNQQLIAFSYVLGSIDIPNATRHVCYEYKTNSDGETSPSILMEQKDIYAVYNIIDKDKLSPLDQQGNFNIDDFLESVNESSVE